MKRTYLLAASLLASALALALALAACGSSGSSEKTTAPPGGNTSSGATTTGPQSSGPATYPAGPGSITVGSAGFTENVLLADIYADAMSAKGVKVTKHTNIGERPIYMKALNDGSIDFIPEYSGSILSYLDTSASAKSAADVYTALQQKLSDTLVALTYSPAVDSDTITVTQATATKYNLKSIADLASVASKLSLGAPAQFKTRADGVPALKSVYGVTFGRFTPLQAGGAVTITALKNGTVDAADIFSTDSSIAKNGFVSLEDPKNMFAAQNVVPIITKAKLTQPMVDACNAVSAKLDTKTLADLVAKAGSGDPDSVAKEWLASAGLG
jgi:osmoprotectant transport system substrate-binding protein